jgi:hypothetical protein
MKLTEFEQELDALKERKYDIGIGQKRKSAHGEKSSKFNDDDIQKAWFINKVAW